MPPPIQMRLNADTLADLDSLAASAGTRTQAVRESVAYWHQATAAAARMNADELTRDEWHLLAHSGDPTGLQYLDDDQGGRYPDWSQMLALELVGVWEGRPLLLPSHKEEKKASEKLARKIGGWGPARGYALMAALRWFWRHPDTADAWWHLEVWLVAETREGE